MKPFGLPPAPKSVGLSEWQKHWLCVARENPQLITNRQRNKKANEEWIKKSKQKPPTYPF